MNALITTSNQAVPRAELQAARLAKRRSLVQRTALIGAVIAAPFHLSATCFAQDSSKNEPLPDDLLAAMRQFTQGKSWRFERVSMDIAELIDNGNSVPISVNVESAMIDSDFVKRIAIFNEKNPSRDVAVFSLSPLSGLAQVSTRIRLVTSQRLVAVAHLSNDTFCATVFEVIVTLAACIESD
jgi:sulfur-oxidizing protein SoxY